MSFFKMMLLSAFVPTSATIIEINPPIQITKLALESFDKPILAGQTTHGSRVASTSADTAEIRSIYVDRALDHKSLGTFQDLKTQKQLSVGQFEQALAVLEAALVDSIPGSKVTITSAGKRGVAATCNAGIPGMLRSADPYWEYELIGSDSDASWAAMKVSASNWNKFIAYPDMLKFYAPKMEGTVAKSLALLFKYLNDDIFELQGKPVFASLAEAGDDEEHVLILKDFLTEIKIKQGQPRAVIPRTSSSTSNMAMITYNMAGSDQIQDIARQLVSQTNKDQDIKIFVFQETFELKFGLDAVKSALVASKKGKAINDALRSELTSEQQCEHTILATTHMMGLHMVIFQKPSAGAFAKELRSVSTNKPRTKGAVALELEYKHNTILVIGLHLSSKDGPEADAKREEEFGKIKNHFQTQWVASDRRFVLGDFNSSLRVRKIVDRAPQELDAGDWTYKPAYFQGFLSGTSPGEEQTRAKQNNKDNIISPWSRYVHATIDQLSKISANMYTHFNQAAHGADIMYGIKAHYDLFEKEIHFEPTYKVDQQTGGYLKEDGSKIVTSAWTDRAICGGLTQGEKLSIEYVSDKRLQASDHAPVMAFINLEQRQDGLRQAFGKSCGSRRRLRPASRRQRNAKSPTFEMPTEVTTIEFNPPIITSITVNPLHAGRQSDLKIRALNIGVGFLDTKDALAVANFQLALDFLKLHNDQIQGQFQHNTDATISITTAGRKVVAHRIPMRDNLRAAPVPHWVYDIYSGSDDVSPVSVSSSDWNEVKKSVRESSVMHSVPEMPSKTLSSNLPCSEVIEVLGGLVNTITKDPTDDIIKAIHAFRRELFNSISLDLKDGTFDGGANPLLSTRRAPICG